MSKGNDQLVPTVPGTDVGGHDTAGVDGKERTERSGEILGTVDHETPKETKAARELETERTDFVTKEVDRANREDLPKLGGPNAAENWEAIEGGPPESISGAKVIGPRGGTTTAEVKPKP
jgi:hypothetical protein